MDIVPLIVNGPFDYTTPYTDFDKVFKVKIPKRSEWGKGNPLEGYDVKIYTGVL